MNIGFEFQMEYGCTSHTFKVEILVIKVGFRMGFWMGFDGV